MRSLHDLGNRPFQRVLSRVLVALALAAILLPTGCVRRRLAVRSNPPGALVFVDNQQIGTTPCSVDFTYYGTREIRLVKPGYETLTVNQPIPTPWYEIPPLDFASENLMPNKIEDHRTVSFDLQPQVIVPTDQLLDRANQLRQETLQGAAAPPPAIGAFGPPPPSFTPAPAPMPTPLPPVTDVEPPSSFAPSIAAPTSSPFAPPTLPAGPPISSPQQGPPLVSPPLR